MNEDIIKFGNIFSQLDDKQKAAVLTLLRALNEPDNKSSAEEDEAIHQDKAAYENHYKLCVEATIDDVIDKVRGLTDLLFALSTGIEYGLEPCDRSLALLATITQDIECDLKTVLQGE